VRHGSSRHVSESCTYVLSDGARFRCPLRIPTLTSVPQIEHAKSCTRLSTLVISAALRRVAVRISGARECLTAAGLRVVGGLVLPPPPQRQESPSGELDTSAAIVAFYTSRGRAQQLYPATEKRAGNLKGQVVRRGLETIVWYSPPTPRLRENLLACTAG
jgi:hypothetical protein